MSDEVTREATISRLADDDTLLPGKWFFVIGTWPGDVPTNRAIIEMFDKKFFVFVPPGWLGQPVNKQSRVFYIKPLEREMSVGSVYEGLSRLGATMGAVSADVKPGATDIDMLSSAQGVQSSIWEFFSGSGEAIQKSFSFVSSNFWIIGGIALFALGAVVVLKVKK